MKYKHFLLITFAAVALTTLSCVECSETQLRIPSNAGLQLLEKATALAESNSQNLEVSHSFIRVLVGRIQEYKNKSSPGQVALDSDGASVSPDGLSSQEAMLAMCAKPCVPPVNVEVQTDPNSRDAGPLSELNAQIMQLQAKVLAHATTIAARDAAIDRLNIQVQKSADWIRKIARQRQELKSVNQGIVSQYQDALETANALQAEVADRDETIAARDQECDELRAIAEQVPGLEDGVARLNTQVAAHVATIDARDLQITDLSTEINRLRPLADQVPGLNADVACLSTQVAAHVATIDARDLQITDLSTEVDRLQGIVDQVPGLQAEVLCLQGELAAARAASRADFQKNTRNYD
ncbi:MAG: hypothetical protein COY39_01570 [Alphaproteobacteria bacterium CG_4_10_14_0_8_um_filter_37_21]|nr:MAG: hypothetical protein COY39_01570 [Alphaproteobacteria bacterium CG_4_10_14_0_8_um_filter_37_21]